MHKKNMPMMLVMLLIVLAGAWYAWQGFQMHRQVVIEEARFHSLQSSYFILDKATRESAQTGSELNQQLVEIQNYPSTLLQLKLVGIGRLLTGIFILLFAILLALLMMPIRLGGILKENQ